MTYTSPTKRARVMLLKGQNHSNRAIADILGIPKSTVHRLGRDYAEKDDFYAVRQKVGRPREFTSEMTRQAVQLLATMQAADASDLQRKFFPQFHPETIRLRLRETGLKAYVRRKKPLLTEGHIAGRLWWGEKHEGWQDDDWAKVHYSDESKFNLVGSDGRKYCWREPGQELDPRYVDKRVKHGGGSIMVWGVITSSGVGRLVRIDGNMDAELYVEILKDDYLGTLKDLGIKKKDAIFQQDNDPKHTAKRTKTWFKNNKVKVLPWAPSSPDMNIIEHVWAYLERRIRTRKILPRNKDELWEALVEEWYSIEPEYIEKLYASIPGRVKALVEAKGKYTRY